MLIFIMILCLSTLSKVQPVDIAPAENPPPSTVPVTDEIPAGEVENEITETFVLALAQKVPSAYRVSCAVITADGDDTDAVTVDSAVYRCIGAVRPDEEIPSENVDVIYGSRTVSKHISELKLKSYENLFSIRIVPDSDTQELVKSIPISEDVTVSDGGDFELYARIYEREEYRLDRKNVELLPVTSSECSLIFHNNLEGERCFKAKDTIGEQFIGGAVVYKRRELWGIVIAIENLIKHFWAARLSKNTRAKLQPVHIAPAENPPPYTELATDSHQPAEPATYPPSSTATATVPPARVSPVADQLSLAESGGVVPRARISRNQRAFIFFGSCLVLIITGIAINYGIKNTK